MPEKDYLKDVDLTPTKVDQPTAPTPEGWTTPSPETMVKKSASYLRKRGYEEWDIEALLYPYGYQAETPHGFDAMNLLDDLRLATGEDVDNIRAAFQMSDAMAADGLGISERSFEDLVRLSEYHGSESIRKMAKTRKWSQRANRKLAEKWTDLLAYGHTNMSLGLSLLDTASYIDKKVKMLPLPAHKKVELEQRVLPKITIFEGTDMEAEHSVGSTAAINIMMQRVYGAGEKIAGTPLTFWGELFNNDTMREIGEATQERGAMRIDAAKQELPDLVTALGEPLYINEVVERFWDEEDVDSYYSYLDDMGMYGQKEMFAIAAGSAMYEMVNPAFLVPGRIAANIAPAGRAIVGAVAPAKTAKITKDIARHTFVLEDALDAVSAAEKNLARVIKTNKITRDALKVAGQPGTQTRNAALKEIAARRELADNKSWLNQFSDPGPHTTIMLGNARRTRLPDVKTTMKYIDETGKRNVITTRKNIDEIAAELHDARYESLYKRPESSVDWGSTDLPLFQQRMLLGPDDAEQAGYGLKHFVRSGGTGIDDIATTPTQPLYSVIDGPSSELSLIDWRLAQETGDAAKEVATLSKLWGGSSQYNLGVSSLKMLKFQQEVIKKNLGFARRMGVKTNIKLHEAELKAVKKAQRVYQNKAKTFSDKKVQEVYDDRWLPARQTPVMGSPERYNSWLEKAGDSAIRSLYPGGLITSNFGNTKMGQILAPFREPRRVMQTYDPAAWDNVRSGYLRYNQQIRAWYDETARLLEDAGIITRRKEWNLKKEWSPWILNEEANIQGFRLADVPKGSDAWNELAKGASPQMLKAQDKIRAILDHAAKRQGISEDPKYLTGYIKHVFTADQFADGARPMEYIGLPRHVEVFAAHLLGRTGKAGYKEDLVSALDLYGRAMYRKMTIEPMYDDILRSGNEMARKTGNNNFITMMNDMVSDLQGKPTAMGYRIDQWLGGSLNKDGDLLWRPGKIDRSLIGLSGMIWAGALASNPRYPVMQIATGIATTSGRYGALRSLKALFNMGTREGQSLSKRTGVYDTFLDVFEASPMRTASQLIAKRGYTLSPFGVMSTAQTEEFIRGLTFHAAMDMHLTKFGFANFAEAEAAGWGQRVMFSGLLSTEEVNHMFGAMGRAAFPTRTFLPGKGTAVAGTQFLSFIPKQTEELLSQFNRNPGSIVEYLAVSGLMSKIAAQEFGIDVTNYLGFGYMPESLDEVSAPAVDFLVKGFHFMGAAATYDPVETKRTGQDFLQSLAVAIPGISGFYAAGKAAERVYTGKAMTAKGEKIRDLDFKAIMEQKDKPLGQRIVESIRPPNKEYPGVGGDLLSSATSQQSIRDKLHRRNMEGIIRRRRRFFYEAEKALQDYIEACDDGDKEKEFKALEKFTDLTKIRIDAASAIERKRQAHELSWIFREFKSNPKLIDILMDEMDKRGMVLQP